MDLLIFFCTAVAVALLFYSSSFKNPHGIIDSIQAYTNFFHRAHGADIHIHPWYYYFQVLRPEIFILPFALTGIYFSIQNNAALPRFLAIFTIILFAIYIAIPYKTPWCILGPLSGIIILAGIGISQLYTQFSRLLPRIILSAIVLAALSLTAYNAIILNFKLYDSPKNPYVYSHPTTDIFKIAGEVRTFEKFAPDSFTVSVICPGHEYWPLPWYLRQYNNIAWLSVIEPNAPSVQLIIVDTTLEDQLAKNIYNSPDPSTRKLFMRLFENPISLRPGRYVQIFANQQWYDRVKPLIP